MHVGVEIPVAQRVLEEELQDALGKIGPVNAQRIDGVVIAQWGPFGPTQRHHAACRKAPYRARNAKPGVPFGVGGELGGRGGLQPKVQLAHHHPFKMSDHVGGAQPPGRRQRPFDQTGRQIKRVNIALERPHDPGAQHLDRDILARRGNARAVNLCDGRRRDRLGKAGKQRIDRLFQLIGHHRAGLFQRKRRQLVLQIPQLVGQIEADNIGPCRQDLPELDIGRPQRRDRPRDGRQIRIPAQAQQLEGPAHHMRQQPQSGRHVHCLKHHTHRARALKGGAGADQAPKVVRAPHPKASSPNAARQHPSSDCGI